MEHKCRRIGVRGALGSSEVRGKWNTCWSLCGGIKQYGRRLGLIKSFRIQYAQRANKSNATRNCHAPNAYAYRIRLPI